MSENASQQNINSLNGSDGPSDDEDFGQFDDAEDMAENMETEPASGTEEHIKTPTIFSVENQGQDIPTRGDFSAGSDNTINSVSSSKANQQKSPPREELKVPLLEGKMNQSVASINSQQKVDPSKKSSLPQQNQTTTTVTPCEIQKQNPAVRKESTPRKELIVPQQGRKAQAVSQLKEPAPKNVSPKLMWEAATDYYGRIYYYHLGTCKSQWTKPPEFDAEVAAADVQQKGQTTNAVSSVVTHQQRTALGNQSSVLQQDDTGKTVSNICNLRNQCQNPAPRKTGSTNPQDNTAEALSFHETQQQKAAPTETPKVSEQQNIIKTVSYGENERQNSAPRKNSNVRQHIGSPSVISGGKASQQRPPTHFLMIQDPLPTDTNTTAEESGWFVDYFMNDGNGDTCSTSKQAYWEQLFLDLVRFKEVHGHCRVPPSSYSPHAGSSKEERENARLADWASVQRQLFREIQLGRRIATHEDKLRFRRLEALGFVFNYEEWHWNQKYDELVKFHRLQEERKVMKGQGDFLENRTGKDMTFFAKCFGLAMWVQQQRRIYMDGLQGKIRPMRADRVKKLEKINFSWAAASNEKTLGKSAESAVAFVSSFLIKVASTDTRAQSGSADRTADKKARRPECSVTGGASGRAGKRLKTAAAGPVATATDAMLATSTTEVSTTTTPSGTERSPCGEESVKSGEGAAAVSPPTGTSQHVAKTATHVCVSPETPTVKSHGSERTGAVTPDTANSSSGLTCSLPLPSN